MSTDLAYNRQAPAIQAAVNGARQIRDGRDQLKNAIAQLQTMIDGDGSQVANYTHMASVCGFNDAASAQASWNELNSLYAKVSVDTDVTAVFSAVNQCCAKHGV